MSSEIDVTVVQGPADRPTLIVDGLHVAGPDHFNQNRVVEEWTIRGAMADRLRARLSDARSGLAEKAGRWANALRHGEAPPSKDQYADLLDTLVRRLSDCHEDEGTE